MTMMGVPDNIRILKNRHKGDTIYVLGSSASLNWIDPAFFATVISVGINDIFRIIRTSYVLMHHHESGQEAIDAGARLVVSERDWGNAGWGKLASFSGHYFAYRTDENARDGNPRIDVDALKEDTTDSLVVSPCTTSEALQFAAHLGASTIICCGLDGASIDGQWCVRGYNGGAFTNPQHIRLTQQIMQQTLAAIRAKGVHVYSLSPFVGADHEGHVYEQPQVLEGALLHRAIRTINWQRQGVLA